MNESPSPYSSVPQSQPPRQGLSVTSLVLGILSFLGCSIFTGIPAIITGHIARGRAQRQPELYGGAGMALAGLILGYIGSVFIFIAMLAALLLPALARAKGRAQTIQCANQLKQVGLAIRIWGNDHNQKLPPDFLSMSNELVLPKFLVCPGDKSREAAASWSEFDPMQNVSYEYLTPNAKESDVERQPIVQCPIHGNITFGDGHVEQNRGRR
jgi:prepilin-type processing-associated H-X9-DG protein